MKMGFLVHLLLFFRLFLVDTSSAGISRNLGINYGQLGDNLPSPSDSINLIKTLKIGRVKLYDPNPEILKALSGTKLQVSTMVPNQLLINISKNQTLADSWIETNILPFYPKTRIRTILVGNEILSDYNNKATWFSLVPAMENVQNSLKKFKLKNIKVGTPLAMDCLESSFPPSNGTFRSDISESVMKPMLNFLQRTDSNFFIDVYPYFPWSANPNSINLNYALFDAEIHQVYIDPVSNLTYTNLLDQQLDAIIFAMTKLKFPDIPLTIAETGWPNGGDIDQIGCNIYNAAIYNRNLARKVTARPAKGTPARPGKTITTYIFSLYNENRKPGPGTERNWGLFYPNKTLIYPIDLTGRRPDSDYPPLPKPTNNNSYKGKIWCVLDAAVKRDITELSGALAYACSQGRGICDEIQKGKACYLPNSLKAHANYAFNTYWQQFRNTGGTCYFNGLATQTTKDPSYGSCIFPSGPTHGE